MSGLFRTGDFRLASGRRGSFKIDCDALDEGDIHTLALLLTQRLPPFGSVEGVPTGGLRLAAEMERYATAGPLLIVDDVWTTGGSMNRHRRDRDAVGAVLFARGPVDAYVTALFQMVENQGSRPT